MAELTTIAAVKTYLGETGTGNDALLSTTLASVERMIRGLCNRPNGFVSAIQTERFDGEWAQQLVLTYTPVASVTTVKAYTDNTTTVTFNSALYRLDPNTYSGILSLIAAPDVLWDLGFEWPVGSSKFPGGFRNMEVVYPGGYTTVPADLSQIAIEFTSTMFRQRKFDPSMQSETLGNYSYARAAGQPQSRYEMFRDQLFALGYVRGGVLTP